MARLALETGDERLCSAAKTIFNNIADRRMYITGGIGSSSVGEAFTVDYHLPNLTAYAESCAALGLALFLLRKPLLTLYNLNDSALVMADQLIIVMSFIMVGMSYQMPVSMGIIRGGGDTKFTMMMNMISTWAIVIPLSFMSAFWWHWSVVSVVIMIQSDPVF